MKDRLNAVAFTLSIACFLIGCSDQPREEEGKDLPRSHSELPGDQAGEIESQSIVGRWKVERPNGMMVGTLIFTEDGRYTLTEQRLGSVNFTHEGVYRLDATKFPTSIDLILGDVGESADQPVETTGTLSFISSDRIEVTIRLNVDSSRQFNESIEENSIILTRIY